MVNQNLLFRIALTGRLWPSGDFSVGTKKIWLGDKPESKIREFNPDQYKGFAPPHTPTMDGISRWITTPCARVKIYRDMQEAWENPGLIEDTEPPLDLTDGRNPHKPKNRPESYGRLGMTGYGKKMVRSACAILERRYKGRLTFATVTMPTLPPEMRIALAECWPEFLRQALQWLSRKLDSQRLPKAVCSVSEVQPNRLKAGNGGYLHLHMVWPNHKMRKGHFAIDVIEFRTWCESFLIRNGLWVEGSWVNIDTQPVEVSAAAYLSKYMSKGGDVLDLFVAENGWSACPGQWWNLTKPLRDKVKAELLEGTRIGELLQMAIDYAFQCDDFTHFWSVQNVDLEFDGRFVTVGWCGILKDEVRKHFVMLCNSAR